MINNNLISNVLILTVLLGCKLEKRDSPVVYIFSNVMQILVFLSDKHNFKVVSVENYTQRD